MKFIKNLFKKKPKNNITILIIIASIFGLLGGISGQIFSDAYVLEDYYQVPYLGEISLKNGVPGGSLIIRDARKVVVEQDDKIEETIDSSLDSIVGIFRKKTLVEGDDPAFSIEKYYKLNEERGQGIIITSDGWILTSAFSPNIRTELDILTNYVIITRDKKVYEIDKVLRNTTSNFGFIHAKDVKDLNVSKFEMNNTLPKGKQIISVNWEGESFLSQILNNDGNEKITKSSDLVMANVLLTSDLPENFKGSPIFDLSGYVVAIIDNSKNIEQFNNYISEINSLLKYNELRKPKLGVNYINLSDFIINDKNYEKGALISKNEEGVAIEKNSPADLAGLTEGDVITSIDNIEINSDVSLNQVIQKYLAGDIINLNYNRNEQRNQVKIQLGSID